MKTPSLNPQRNGLRRMLSPENGGAYRQGLNTGYNSGYGDGFAHGYRIGLEQGTERAPHLEHPISVARPGSDGDDR
jgi:hypothetical protein